MDLQKIICSCVVSSHYSTFGNYEGLVKQPLTHEEIVGNLLVRSPLTNGSDR